MPNETDTCRRHVVPRLQGAGWDTAPYRINEQVTFTDGRIVVAGQRGRRRPGERGDHILRYRPDLAVAVFEARPTYATPGDGLQQAKDYAEVLGLKVAYATSGDGFIEFDYTTRLEKELDDFPTPSDLRIGLSTNESLSTETSEKPLTSANHISDKLPHYYQEIENQKRAVNILSNLKPVEPLKSNAIEAQDTILPSVPDRTFRGKL